MSHSALHVGSTHILEVEGLKDHLDAVQTDATVELVSLTDKRTGAAVAGVTVPLAMPHVSSGLYRATLPHGAVLTAGRVYEGLFRAVGIQGFRAEWIETLIASVREA